MIFPINKEGKLQNTRLFASNNNNTYTRNFYFDLGFFKIQPVTRDNDHSIIYGQTKSKEAVLDAINEDNSSSLGYEKGHNCLKHLIIITGLGYLIYSHLKKNNSK